MAIITSPTYDPQTTATNLANAYIKAPQAVLDAQVARDKSDTAALATLGTALSTFQTAINALANGASKTISARGATFSDTTIATGSAGALAAAGSYSFFVEQVATAGQVSFGISNGLAPNNGKLNIKMGDNSIIEIDLATANTDNNGELTPKEIAAAINASSNNDGKLTASTITINGDTRLVLTSTKTGKDAGVEDITLTGATDPTLSANLASKTVLTAANNAIVWSGPKTTGTKIEQASNTFTVIDDVSFTIAKAQGASDAPITLKVGADTAATTANVQSFVTAYNNLYNAISSLTQAGNAASNVTPGVLNADSGVKALRDQLGTALRAATGGLSLVSFGITGNRDGTLSLDTARLTKAVAANPGSLDTMFGSSSSLGLNDSGVLGKMNKLISSWTDTSKGTISVRKQASTKLQSQLADRQTALEVQFNNAYRRYLTQFTTLQQLQSSMTNTSNLFTELFSSSSKT
ncbi:flagellar filament capping protein FliD [Duganella sp. FT27W]|uniref:flagellar filament capping protein FliD n=1 Tax=Duganella sp. FT27W TaxID=2654636 RepID=UPI00128DF6F6|nr:flagellar filament capping protein FliD [Duganella sp. FT27W]MPQ55526.1 flagellar filament capping protein FliD [Duganella sp. FT27W]